MINAMLRYINGACVGYVHESGVMTSALAYIDDCCLLAESAAGSKEQVRRLNAFYEWAGLAINHSKCAIFARHFGTKSNPCTNHILIKGVGVPRKQPHQAYKYLGMMISGNGSWAAEKSRVRQSLAECIQALKGSPYSPRQLDQVVHSCLLPIFRYGAGMVDWTSRELDDITAMWANARRIAWKLPSGSPHCLHTLHRQDGGAHLPHAKTLWAKEMMTLINACRQHDDDLRVMTEWEWRHSVRWVGSANDRDAARELTTPVQPVGITDLSNRYRRVCRQMGTTVQWMPQDPFDTGIPIAQASRPVRANAQQMTESVLMDPHPLAL